MSKILVVGDLHGRVSVLDDFKRMLDEIISAATQEKVSNVILLGDLNDNFSVVRGEIMALYYQFFLKLKSLGIPCIVLVGNHDYCGQESKYHTLEPFKSVVTVVDELTDVELADGSRHLFIPFYRDTKAFESMCRSVAAGMSLFCHQSFDWVTFNNGEKDKDGADTLCVSHLKKVVCGHIHKECRASNIWYAGTPMQINFGEAGEEKFLYVLDSSTLEEVKRIATNAPRFIDIKAEKIEDIRLPENPRPVDTYRFVSSGTSSEIRDFWKRKDVQEFRKLVRGLTDKFTVVGSSGIVLGDKKIADLGFEEKVKAYANARKWRTGIERIINAIRPYLS